MTHPNEELIRRGYTAFSEGDLDTVRELFADDIVWHVNGRNKLTGDYKGMDEVMGFFAKIMETADNVSQEIHEVLANDTHATALLRASMEVNGTRVSDNSVHVFHIEGGKVTEFWSHPWNPYQFDEAIGT